MCTCVCIPAPPSTGLYFTLRGTVYLPGDTVLITDIERENTNDSSDPESSLACNTINVNTHCCRSIDGKSRGEWYLPNGTRILNNPRGQLPDGTLFLIPTDKNFYRTRYTQQVRLY